MAKNDPYILENLIRDSEKILEDLGDFSAEGGFSSGNAESVQDEIRKEEMEAVDASARPVMDGYVELTASEDFMLVRGDFYPPSEGRQPIALDGVERQLYSYKISHGIDWEALREAVFKCNTEGVPITEVAVARGTRPKKEVMPYLVIEAGLLGKQAEAEPEDQRLDYRERSPFRLVKKGELLARLVPKKTGETGFDVTGASLPFGKEVPEYPKPGKNTEWAGGAVKAACEGRFVLEDESFWVNEVLEVKGSVDYSTGHVRFPGDVVIAGDIKQGFKVQSGGSIFCSKLIDATEITAARDIVTGQGILGRKSGVVKAGGSIQTKFIENCFVEALGPIKVSTGCLNSVVQTLDRLDTGPRGVISGGKIYARNGINVAQLGTASGPKTEIICGIDYTVQQKLLWIRDKSIALAMKLREVERRLASPAGITPELEAVRAKLKAAIHQLNETAKELVIKLDKNDQAEVVVRGSIYPGTYIEICHVSLIVTSVLTHQRLRLDKASGRIVSGKIAH